MVQSFVDRLREIQTSKTSALCVGLDPDPALMPPHLLHSTDLPDAVLQFCRDIIEATHPYACAFKVNFAFFEVLGEPGWRVLHEVIRSIPRHTLIIADAKRGDIGNSGRFYARAVFEQLDCDAITVSPYMGRDSVEPFLAYEGKAAFILSRTSNPGARDFQERSLEGEPLYLRVAEAIHAWDSQAQGTAGLVVGATSAEALNTLRNACPSLPFLIPGVGAQGGDAQTVMRSASTPEGLVIVNSSRAILYASSDKDFAEAAAGEAERLAAQLQPTRGE